MKRQKTFKNHLTFWGILIAGFTLIQFFKDGNDQSFTLILLQNIKRLPAMILTAYTFNNILIPHFYRLKKYVTFGLLSTSLFYMASVLDRIINVYAYEPLTRKRPFPQESLIEIFSDLSFLFNYYLPPLLLTTFIMTVDIMIREKNIIEKRNLELERDRQIAELKMLKSQINPHFLFNTLNNLYALTLQKSDKAPRSIARLSEMLDYMLYQCNDKFVSLQKEVELLKNYIALEQLRYGDDIDIKFKDHCDKPMQIAPFILLSIVENAFKHGTANYIKTPKITIEIFQKDTVLYFKVENTKNKDVVDRIEKGIGVGNIKQQLNLLYPEYTYDILEKENMYCVTLTINTAYVHD